MAITKLGEAMTNWSTVVLQNDRKDFAFNAGKQGIVQQNGEVVDSSKWFKDNCQKQGHTVYLHSDNKGTLKSATPMFWLAAKDEQEARMAKLTASYGIAWSLKLHGTIYMPGPLWVVTLEAIAISRRGRSIAKPSKQTTNAKDGDQEFSAKRLKTSGADASTLGEAL